MSDPCSKAFRRNAQPHDAIMRSKGAWGCGSPVATAERRRRSAALTESADETPNKQRLGAMAIQRHCLPVVSGFVHHHPLWQLIDIFKKVFYEVFAGNGEAVFIFKANC